MQDNRPASNLHLLTQTSPRDVNQPPDSRNVALQDEAGWALLGLLLALSIIGIMLLAAVPNVQTEVRREKEIEMIYRGQHVAKGIARYYNQGRRGNIGIQHFQTQPPPYGPLLELEKLKEGINLGVNEIRFVRSSALIEPLSNEEWEPVRIGDPRIANALQSYAAWNNVIVPPSLLRLAGNAGQLQIIGPIVGGEEGQRPGATPGAPPQTKQQPEAREPGEVDDGDAGDDDDTDLDRLFGGMDNRPIIGVAPKVKGRSIRTLWGMSDYSEWAFIHVEPQGIRLNQQLPPGVLQRPGVPPEVQR
jgi:type II secretory pathway pseudopilin PulG